MNYLAHLHIAEHCSSDFCGNLLGDFVKGDPAKYYPETVSKGIQLHRFVDSYTDGHELVKQAKSYFPMHQRRFSGIALDMFWDHCLSKNWPEYSGITLEEFVNYSKEKVMITQTKLADDLVSESYLRVTSRMWEKNWLYSYQNIEVMQIALKNISHRRARFDELANCYATLVENYAPLVKVFQEFYPQVLKRSQEQSKSIC